MPLTTTQRRVLQFLHDFHLRKGSMPTRVDIAREFGWKSGNAAECHIQKLRAKGYVLTTPGTARGLRFTEEGLRLLALPSPVPGAAVPMLGLPVVNMARLNYLARRPRHGDCL